MASNAFAGVGASFKRNSVAVAEVNSVSGPTMSRAAIDVTSLDSTSGYREFIAGFRDGGEITLNMNFTRDSYDDFLVDYQSDTVQTYSIELPDAGATSFSFSGWVTGLTMGVPTDDKVTSDVTIKITGPVTLTS